MFGRRAKSHHNAKTERSIRQGSVLCKEFEQDGRPESLEGAISAFHRALGRLPADSVIARGVTIDMALCYDRRGRVFQNAKDLDTAIQHISDVLQSAPDDEAARPLYKLNLALVFRHRFELSRNRLDLDHALTLDEEVYSRGVLANEEQALFANNLAKDLSLRFRETAQIADLDRAIQLQDQAMGLVAAGDPQRYGYLNNCAIYHVDRYRLRSNPADLNQAISQLELALDLTSPSSPDRPGCMLSLAQALSLRTARTDNETDDWGSGAQLFMDIVAGAAPDTDIYRAAALGVADAFVARYPQTLDPNLLVFALRISDELLSGTSEGSIDPTVLWTRAEGFRLQYSISESEEDRRESSECAERACRLAMESGPMNTLHSARQWAEWAESLSDWTEASKAYEWCLKSTLMLVGRQYLRQQKEEWLRSTIGLASDAPYGLAMSGRVEDAVVAAEQCRGILLSEFLGQHELTLDRLRESGHSELCRRYEAAVAAAPLQLHEALAYSPIR